jgi:aspartate aminotransferase-like enzyme
MSKSFQSVMKRISEILKNVYNADSTALVPGSGTFGMESVARQFAQNKRCLVIRNGWFSYRWTQIFEMGNIAASCTVLKARRNTSGAQAPFSPVPVEEAVKTILAEKPDVVFAPHVETSAGMILPDAYLKAVTQAVHSYGGIFVLDCIASGAMWVDMKATGVDVLISAPQKGWSSTPCCAMIAMSAHARKVIDETTSSSYACDLKKWLQIMETYEAGNHSYHTTMPTDALVRLCSVMEETQSIGFKNLMNAQIELGTKIRTLLESHGFKSVAEKGFQSPCVVVSYTTDPEIQSSRKFIAQGLQTAAGVPLQCDEGSDFMSFRLGLFGLEKLQHVDRTIHLFEQALETISPQRVVEAAHS